MSEAGMVLVAFALYFLFKITSSGDWTYATALVPIGLFCTFFYRKDQ